MKGLIVALLLAPVLCWFLYKFIKRHEVSLKKQTKKTANKKRQTIKT